MTRKRPTIDDVASLSGVARTTVSRVLNGGPNVRDEVRERVMRAVGTLNYRVNTQARSLAGGSSRMLALILASDLEAEPNSYYASALELGALRECLVLGYQLLARHVPQQSADRHRQILDLMSEQRCEGLILTPPFADDVQLINQIQAQGGQVVLISPGGAGLDHADSVGIDDEKAGHDIAAHLLALGHRQFGFISGIEGHLSAEQRMDGLVSALEAHGLNRSALDVERGDFTFRSGGLMATRLMGRSNPPTALICANDDMAAGALAYAHSRGLDVPGDISITGFDDTPVSEIVWPPLTTVHQPLKAMGREAVVALTARVAGLSADRPPTARRLDHAIVPRASAARAKPRLASAKA